jgi:SAM-dependent methyltransferase
LGAGEARRGERAETIQRIEADYRGYAVYRYEHQFFCVPRNCDTGTFNLADFRDGRYPGGFVAHSNPEIDHFIHNSTEGRTSNGVTLVFSQLSVERTTDILCNAGIKTDSVTFLKAGDGQSWPENSIDCGVRSLLDWARAGGALPPSLTGNVAKIVIPWSYPASWTCGAIEAAAARFTDNVQILFENGESREYFGEDLHRLGYNKAYLSSMFEVVPTLNGRDVLEVGCSDGLVSDLLSACGGRRIVGIDVMRSVGCRFPGPGKSYFSMNASRLAFPDKSFDVVLSIATFEHVPDPLGVLMEVLRVTKPGGYVYVQAGPLYASPHGHHMFAYFQDQPWIHLRKSPDEIVAYAEAHDVGQRITAETRLAPGEYIRSMLSTEHLNGLLLDQYGLDAFMRRKDIEILKFNVSREGENLLTKELIRELEPYSEQMLTTHGFELAFRRT